MRVWVLVLIPFFVSVGQAEKTYELGLKLLKENKIEQAISAFDKVVAADSTHARAHLRLALRYDAQKNYSKALYHYKKVAQYATPSLESLPAFLFLGQNALKTGHQTEGITYLKTAESVAKPGSPMAKEISRAIQTAEFVFAQKQNPQNIEAKPVKGLETIGKYVYFPSIRANEQQLFFTARNENTDENIFVSNAVNGLWTQPVALPFNTPANEGTCTISGDGKTLVFAKCDSEGGFGSCDLYVSYLVNNEWQSPQNMGREINSEEWDSQPSLSADGRTLFFSSARFTGIGGKDLYMSIQNSQGQWSKAVNLGPPINTIKDEISPYFHSNGKNLFFASDGHLGMGKQDLFYTEWKNNKWQPSVNLGYPINTEADQTSLVISPISSTAYYTQVLAGQSVLYQFALPENLQKALEKVKLVEGQIISLANKAPIKATVSLFDLKTQQVISTVFSDAKTGLYSLVLPHGHSFGLHISADRHFFKSWAFEKDTSATSSSQIINFELQPISKSQTVQLNNIYFDPNQSDLKPESQLEINKLVGILVDNPSIKIEISGHTDDVGSETANLQLSERRSAAVVKACLDRGIASERIISVGYGETKPLVPNVNEENRKMNRRIEFRVI